MSERFICEIACITSYKTKASWTISDWMTDASASYIGVGCDVSVARTEVLIEGVGEGLTAATAEEHCSFVHYQRFVNFIFN